MATLRTPPLKRKLPTTVKRPPAPAKPPAKPAQPAKKPAGKPAAAAKASMRPGPVPSSATGAWVAGLFLLMLGFVLALPTVPLLIVGMIPTAVAFFVDRSPGKSAAICVLGLNFAGVAPFIAILWRGSNTLTQSFSMLGDVYVWFVMYGAAALGWLLSMGLAPLVASFLKILAAQQIAALRAQQAELRDEWGIAVEPKAPAKPQ